MKTATKTLAAALTLVLAAVSPATAFNTPLNGATGNIQAEVLWNGALGSDTGYVVGGEDTPQIVVIGGKAFYVINGVLVDVTNVTTTQDIAVGGLEEVIGQSEFSDVMTIVQQSNWLKSFMPATTVLIEYEDGQKSAGVETDTGFSIYHEGSGEVHLGSAESLDAYLSQTNGTANWGAPVTDILKDRFGDGKLVQ